MKNLPFCTLSGRREELLVSYLYAELAPADRADFDRHLRACAACRDELDVLGAVRGGLASWAPPETAGRLAADVAAPPAARPAVVSVFRDVPAWVRAAAAVLVVGLSAGAANLEISRTGTGFSVRTGWRHPVAAGAAAGAVAPAVAVPTAMADGLDALARDLRALERRIADVSSTPSGPGDEAVLRRVRALVEESERRQQREIALRVADVARDLQAQRRIDLVRIDRSLGLIQSRTGMEVMRTQRQVNSLAQQVSQRP
jgi:hypothetical protein